MAQKLSKTAKRHRSNYNNDYQKQYVRRYVFKLNSKHDQELIEILEHKGNKNAWFKECLKEEA